MCSLGSQELLWQSPTIVVLVVLCMGGVAVVLATMVSDFLWQRRERDQQAAREKLQPDERDRPSPAHSETTSRRPTATARAPRW
jgi:hypothetical protein